MTGPGTDMQAPPELEAAGARSAILARLMAGDPRVAFVGRAVSLAGDRPDGPQMVADIARLTGYSSAHFVPENRWDEYRTALQAAGLNPAQWPQLLGRGAAIEAARAFLANYEPPPGLTLKQITPQTGDDVIGAFRATSYAAGVTPAVPSVLRGDGPPGVILYVEAENGAVAATGGGFMAYPKASGHGTDAYWGMLSTAQTWRGRRLACWVGAEVIVHLADRFGATSFSSGVKADNTASQAMCARLAIGPSGLIYAGATDPRLLGTLSITR